VTYTVEQLAEAIAAAGRYGYRPPLWMFSSLRPYTPSKPPKPPTTESTEIVRTTSYEPPVASAAAPEPPAVPATKVEAEVVPVWQALVDVTVWRSRPWWWRLAASLVVKRLNR
jgi:hypothetical protein